MEILVKDKIQRVKGFFQVLKTELSRVEKSILDPTIERLLPKQRYFEV